GWHGWPELASVSRRARAGEGCLAQAVRRVALDGSEPSMSHPASCPCEPTLPVSTSTDDRKLALTGQRHVHHTW
ncbi:MAG: hypothetical protein ACRELT_04665, partial [Longimicrobiales bacterium]